MYVITVLKGVAKAYSKNGLDRCSKIKKSKMAEQFTMERVLELSTKILMLLKVKRVMLVMISYTPTFLDLVQMVWTFQGQG